MNNDPTNLNMAMNMTPEERKKVDELKVRMAQQVQESNFVSIRQHSSSESDRESPTRNASQNDTSTRSSSSSVLGKLYTRHKHREEAERVLSSIYFSSVSTVEIDWSDQKEFLNDNTYVRYLRARQLDLDKAEDMLYHSLVWRSAKRPEKEICQACLRNRRAHSLRVIGRDIFGRPVLYSHFAGVENRDPDDNIQHLIWLLENVFSNNEVHLAQQYVWLLDFQGFSLSDMNPSIGTKALTLFSEQYPERLGKAIVMDSPRVFSGLWKILSPFIDSKTHEKITFISLDERHKLFQDLFPHDLVDILERNIHAIRDPKMLQALDWWSSATTSDDCPSRKLVANA